ncbi:glycosyltransferase family 8 protein [Lapidilactobacillus wuchangensis]|uniref:glycosyltransferase family 8 protein n=1 Tax=Lapidilactobacillus wuchangensis TaxID=2486001 RepID=UPI000F78A27B|nr:glycosyltransferase family 8 protein [Lapidilactobacillus wuchangensis]
MMKTAVIPIFYGINDQYAPYLAASLQSLLTHLNPEQKYQVIVLYQKLTLANQQRLGKMATDNCPITFYQLTPDLLTQFGGDDNTLRADYFTLTIYYRLFIADLFPEYDQGVYLDADTIITTDIAQLAQQDLGSHLIGAIPDAFICSDPRTRRYAELAVGVDPDHYINSGVLLLNLKALRAEKFSQHFLKLLNQYHFQLIAPDQDYLNGICYGRTTYLGPTWNLQTEHALPVAGQPAIVHYNLFGKPWCYAEVPYADLFWQFADQTDYQDELRAQLAQYSPSQTAADAEHKDLLMQRIIAFPDETFTFKQARAQGEQVQL